MTDSTTERIARMLCQWEIDEYISPYVTPDEPSQCGMPFWHTFIDKAEKLLAAIAEPDPRQPALAGQTASPECEGEG